MKILHIDIETSLQLAWIFSIGRKVSISHKQLETERQIVCVCYKWDGKRPVYSIDWGLKKQNDKQLLIELSKVLNEADIICAQNGDRYDLRFINGRLAYHDLPPLEAPSTADTLKMSRKAFFLNSHSLDYMGKFFKLGQKMETGGLDLWISVMRKDPKALAKMIKYCKQDVRLLESVYQRISKYSPPRHKPNPGVKLSCPACGNENTIFKGNRVYGGFVYRTRKCLNPDCRHFWRTNIRAN